MIERLNEWCEAFIDKVCVQYFPLTLSVMICIGVFMCVLYFGMAVYTGVKR